MDGSDRPAHLAIAATHFQAAIADTDHFRYLGDLETGRHPWRQIPAIGRIGKNYVIGVFLFHGGKDQLFVHGRVVFPVLCHISQMDGAAETGQVSGIPDQGNRRVGAEFFCKGYQFIDCIKQFSSLYSPTSSAFIVFSYLNTMVLSFRILINLSVSSATSPSRTIPPPL